jgi:hypothetical protein
VRIRVNPKEVALVTGELFRLFMHNPAITFLISINAVSPYCVLYEYEYEYGNHV